jgi:hypothetical protein
VLAEFFFRAKFHSNSLYVVEKKIVGISQYPYFRKDHDYYSTWFPLTAIFSKSEDKLRVIKLKTHYFISASHDG